VNSAMAPLTAMNEMGTTNGSASVPPFGPCSCVAELPYDVR